MTAQNPKYRKVKPTGEDPRGVAEVLNRLVDGKINSVSTVTLAANSGTTTLPDIYIGGTSIIVLAAMSANAAVALQTLYFNTPTKQSVVINHTNNAQTDRTFTYAVLG